MIVKNFTRLNFRYNIFTWNCQLMVESILEVRVYYKKKSYNLSNNIILNLIKINLIK